MLCILAFDCRATLGQLVADLAGTHQEAPGQQLGLAYGSKSVTFKLNKVMRV